MAVFKGDFLRQKRKGTAQYNGVQMDDVTDPPADLNSLDLEDAVKVLCAWFRENFEDPAQNTPYDSKEGGYQYIWGGPYEAWDIFETVFEGELNEELVDAAISKLEHESYGWVPNHGRIQAPDDMDFDGTHVEVSAAASAGTAPVVTTNYDFLDDNARQRAIKLHQRLVSDIEKLEEHLARYENSAAGIGHNNPPEDIEPQFSSDDQEELRQALIELKTSAPVPESDTKVTQSAATVGRLASRLGAWFARRGEDFTEAFAKSAGTELGKNFSRLSVLYVCWELLQRVYESASTWLSSITLPF